MRILRAGLLSTFLAAALTAQTPPPAPTGSVALTDTQIQALQKIQAQEKTRVAASVSKMGDIAKDFSRNMLSDNPDAGLERKTADQLAAGIAEALTTHLASIREMVKVLTPEQRKLLLQEIEKPGADPDIPNQIRKLYGKPQ